MAENSKIEWCTHTFNPVIGCTRVSPGCDNCYAEAMAARYDWHDWGSDTPRRVTSDANWGKPLRWNRMAAAAGERHRVFCASLADVFDPKWPDGVRERLWELIAATPNLDWLLLTKRPNLVARFAPAAWQEHGWPANIWLGFTAEDQEHYERRWPHIAAVPAAVRFVSYEPAVGPLGDLHLHWETELLPDWVIVGGESGPRARVMDPEWARQVLRQCHELDIAIFLKQWGIYEANPLVFEEGLGIAEAKLADPPANGKGGALLDGFLYREFPEALSPSAGSDLFALAEG